MTRDEFEAQRDQLVCKDCGTVGLSAVNNQNNGGVRPHCSACQSTAPLAGVMWLPKAKVKTPPRGKADLDDIWNACGNHCAWCGMTRARLEEVGVGLQADHVVPFWKNGDEWPVQPLCARCHQEKNARQSMTRALEENVAEFKTIIERIESRNPHLRQP